MSCVLSIRRVLRLALTCAVASAALAGCAKRDASPDEVTAYKGVTLGMTKDDVFNYACNGPGRTVFKSDSYCRSHHAAGENDDWITFQVAVARCDGQDETVAVSFANGRVAKIERECSYFWRG